LARVLEEDCQDPRAAQRVLQQGLSDNPSDSALLDELERLAPINQQWQEAAEALEAAIAAATDLAPDTVGQLCVRLAGWYRDKRQDKVSAERALGRALEFEPDNDEVLVLIEQLQDTPGREDDLIATL